MSECVLGAMRSVDVVLYDYARRYAHTVALLCSAMYRLETRHMLYWMLCVQWILRYSECYVYIGYCFAHWILFYWVLGAYTMLSYSAICRLDVILQTGHCVILSIMCTVDVVLYWMLYAEWMLYCRWDTVLY